MRDKIWMFTCICVAVCSHSVFAAFGSNGERVLLSDINVLTLHHGRTTNARRSSPIPQLKCTGGSAGCQSFIPQVVQCYNRGMDGYDAQWECKTDMDNAYRFGQIEVSCEGYDYAEDEYVLRGSCGLEYTLDLTKEGHEKKHHTHGHHDYYGDNSDQTHSNNYSYKQKASSWFGDLMFLVIIGVVIYAIYYTCIANNHSADNGDAGGRRWGGDSRGQPPPPGWRDDSMPGGGCSGSGSSGYSAPGYTAPGYGHRSQGGGFWTGAATGGLLGYMFGGRTNTHYGTPGYARTGWGSGWGSGLGAGSRSSGWGGSTSTSFSSGTRTASGFGGTRRR